jgi:hypothetical protein
MLNPEALLRLKRRNSDRSTRDSYEERHEREQQLMRVREPERATTIPVRTAKVDGRTLRRTGRTTQLNLKTTAEARQMLIDKAATLGLSLAATFELAISQLEAKKPKG